MALGRLLVNVRWGWLVPIPSCFQVFLDTRVMSGLWCMSRNVCNFWAWQRYKTLQFLLPKELGALIWFRFPFSSWVVFAMPFLTCDCISMSVLLLASLWTEQDDLELSPGFTAILGLKITCKMEMIQTLVLPTPKEPCEAQTWKWVGKAFLHSAVF